MYKNPRKRAAPSDAQEEAWVAGEDKFVLQQAKKKAAIRVKENRARPIDWLAVTLRFSDNTRSIFDDEVDDAELNIVDPEGVFDGLDKDELLELEKDIDVYATLEKDRSNLEFWQTMAVICKDRLRAVGPKGRAQDSVAAEVDKMFSKKSAAELDALERQIKMKLRSNEPIDVEYWESLLQSIVSWKARGKLRNVSKFIVDKQLQGLRTQQEDEAKRLQSRLSAALKSRPSSPSDQTSVTARVALLDAEPMLQLRPEDKAIPVQNEAELLRDIAAARERILRLGFVPAAKGSAATDHKRGSSLHDEASRAKALYDREAAKGIEEDEEVLQSEEQVTTEDKALWANKYRPRKPRYFNRVAMGFEWNKYNQTHYDPENPPPKVVQGYRFNIFYPDLIDPTKAPTYKVERENGRKRGQSFAPAGEDDTCLIRFIAGPPYEDIAFRIVDKEWDYSGKYERTFKSTFDKGVLQLHYVFKKSFYRK